MVGSWSAERPEGGTNLVSEQFGLLPGGEVSTPRGFVVVAQGRVVRLGPAAWCLEDLAREGAYRDRDRHGRRGLARTEGVLPFPVCPGGRAAGAGQPIDRDVVEDVLAGEAARRWATEEGAGDFEVTVG